MKTRLSVLVVVVVGLALYSKQGPVTSAAQATAAGTLQCSLAGYRAASGLTASMAGDALALTWDGDKNQELRLRFTVNGGTPTIEELAVRRKGAAWAALATNVTPEFRLVAGKRRMDTQQVNGLKENGMTELTPALIGEHQWNAFWDAPLYVPGGANLTRAVGLPRKPEEVTRATATYQASSCEVKSEGARLIITFPGVIVGMFTGQLQYTVYKGSNLIQQAVLAKTDQDSVAYMYNAGLKGLSIGAGSRVAWRDTTNVRQEYLFGGTKNDGETPIKTANRIVIAERGPAGSIAAFPPPHNFFWTRETSTNLGYNWYRKDSNTSFSFGIRQSEQEGTEEYLANFPLYNARPGTMQHMPVFFYASADAAEPTREAVLAFTHGDRYKPLPGYKVMGHHYHMDLGLRLIEAGTPDAEIEDLYPLKAAGINIVGTAERVGTGGGSGNSSPEEVLKVRQFQIEGARRHSDKDFMIMPSHEYQPPPFGGHVDILYSHPVYWLTGRAAGQPLVEDTPTYGKLYHIGTHDDLMQMLRRENAILSMPHPRTKTNTGYPDGFLRKPESLASFKDPRFESFGFRWGMGIDRSERRWSEYRVLPLFDETLNRFADVPGPPKHLLAISEAHHQFLGDDVYSFSPISYVKLAAVPTPDDATLLIKALMDGDYFVSSGEILITNYSVEGIGTARKVVADVEWTFPLDFVEVVWGDGQKTDRQIISTTEMPAFGRHHFEIPFDATGKKWVRFAAWDTTGNGGLVQAVKLTGPVATR